VEKENAISSLHRCESDLFCSTYLPNACSQLASSLLPACLSVWGSGHYSSRMPVVGMRSKFIKSKKVGSVSGVLRESGISIIKPNHRAGNSSTPAPHPAVLPSWRQHPLRSPILAAQCDLSALPGSMTASLASVQGFFAAACQVRFTTPPSKAGRGSELGVGHRSVAGEVFPSH